MQVALTPTIVLLRPSTSPRRRRHRLRSGFLATLVVVLSGVLIVFCSRTGALVDTVIGANASTERSLGNYAGAAEVLRNALRQVEPLSREVDAGRIVKDFGDTARMIVHNVSTSVDGPHMDVEDALDRVFHALFLQQLAFLRRDVFSRYQSDQVYQTALEKADSEFISRAKELVRPGSSWSFEAERDALRLALKGLLRRDVAVMQERFRVARAQRANSDVIASLQKEMEDVGQALGGHDLGSPWVVWTSYTLPLTSLRLSGRYRPGRANIDISMASSADPVTHEAGFAEGVTSQNVGLSLNIGL
eukprot:TRINITY_DN25006_c1_g1_i1.p1 TRINITY_DN25006_c1_g1~~TRINITY_DN25006_c1_g1_i1.p1  ORF type:complete len:304 (-),score=50.86 TRINITY_DN25006_c1_g1_i1:300-1211(-)